MNEKCHFAEKMKQSASTFRSMVDDLMLQMVTSNDTFNTSVVKRITKLLQHVLTNIIFKLCGQRTKEMMRCNSEEKNVVVVVGSRK